MPSEYKEMCLIDRHATLPMDVRVILRLERDHVMGRIVLRIRRHIPRASALAVAVEQSAAPPPCGF